MSDKNPVIDSNGTKRWYKDGVLHRVDGPALEWVNGHKEWYKDGKLHRADGPAIEWVNGYKYWCLHGIELPKELFLKLTGYAKDLPLYLGLGFDKFIHERLKSDE